MWVQEFAGPAGLPPDPEVWTHEVGGGGWGDRQRQVYTDDPQNAALDGAGHLAITARRGADGITITSARLTTKGRFAVRYGWIEARIRVPAGHGTWPALWLLGTDIDEVGWPACGEIDVMEHVGVDPMRWYGTIHGPGYSGLAAGIGGAVEAGIDLSEDFHRYAVAWDESGIVWLLDGREHHRLTPSDVPGPWPFDHDFYLLVNLAIGGDWPGNDAEPELPTSLLIDWIRVAERGEE
jgi:beta-glucanase (GH16 family)